MYKVFEEVVIISHTAIGSCLFQCSHACSLMCDCPEMCRKSPTHRFRMLLTVETGNAKGHDKGHGRALLRALIEGVVNGVAHSCHIPRVPPSYVVKRHRKMSAHQCEKNMRPESKS